MTTSLSVLIKTQKHMHIFCQWHHSSAQINQFLYSLKTPQTGHSCQLKTTYMKRNSVKSELQREGRKASYQEGCETKSNHRTEAATSADRWECLQQPRLPKTPLQPEMLRRASSGARWAATTAAERRLQQQDAPRSHPKEAVNGKPLQWLLETRDKEESSEEPDPWGSRPDRVSRSLLLFSSNLLKVTMP